MKRTIGKIVVGSGLVLALAACGSSTQTGSATGNTTPVTVDIPAGSASSDNSSANAVPTTGMAPSGMPGANTPHGMPGVLGTVIAVNGSTITLQDQRQQTTTIDVTSNTQIFKQAMVELASVSAGEQISAIGSLEGDTFTATQVRISKDEGAGPADSQSGGNGPAASAPQAAAGTPQPGGMAQAPNATAQPGHGPGDFLIGTVDQVSSDTITVKMTDGTAVPLKLATNGQIMQQVMGSASDITTNARLAVLGEQNATTLTASRIEILPARIQQP